MIWAIWREIYRQDLCLSFNQWLLRVISVNRCLIFKVHPHSWTASAEPFLKWALLLYQTAPFLSTPFFNLFPFFITSPPTPPRVAFIRVFLYLIFVLPCGSYSYFLHHILLFSPFSPFCGYILILLSLLLFLFSLLVFSISYMYLYIFSLKLTPLTKQCH